MPEAFPASLSSPCLAICNTFGEGDFAPTGSSRNKSLVSYHLAQADGGEESCPCSAEAAARLRIQKVFVNLPHLELFVLCSWRRRRRTS